MDAKLWTVGATLFALLYFTLAVTLVWSVLVVALVLAVWVLGMETEGPEGLRYVELELRPALAMVGIFCQTLVILGPHFPPLVSRSLYPVQYATATSVLRAEPLFFFFPLVPLVAGFVMSVHQRLHPLQGIVYQTPTSHSTRVHVHLHNARAAAREEDEAEDEDDRTEAAVKPRHHRHVPVKPFPQLRHLRHPLRHAPRLRASGALDVVDEVEDEDDREEASEHRLGRHGHRKSLRASETAEL